jgi:hypothetical protein
LAQIEKNQTKAQRLRNHCAFILGQFMADLLRPGEVAKQYGFNRADLKQFESMGYVQPVKTKGGHRRYRTQDLERLKAGEFEKAKATPTPTQDITGKKRYGEFGTAGLRRWGGSVYEER